MTPAIYGQISLFADMGLLLPVSAWLFVWVALSDFRLACGWFASMAGLFAVVGVSKLAWALWHMELSSIHFRMLSGHMALACSVWPTVCALIMGVFSLRHQTHARVFAYVCCACIGASRLAGAHTLSEIVSGALIGLAVDRGFAARMRAVTMYLRWPQVFGFLLLVLICCRYGSPIYSVGWFDRIAVRLKRF